jgi:hypothetical protein
MVEKASLVGVIDNSFKMFKDSENQSDTVDTV